MIWEHSIQENIMTRRSVRTYSARPVDLDVIADLNGIIQNMPPGPFGTSPQFQVIQGESGWIPGTYGVIHGATVFLAGTCKPIWQDIVDYAFGMETLILWLTDKGLGTCWLGGTFQRASLLNRMGHRKGRIIPAISPIGYPGGQKRKTDRIFSGLSRSRTRKDWSQLFFIGDDAIPAAQMLTGSYREILNMVHQAPSAMNRQPWRLVVAENQIDVYLDKLIHKGETQKEVNRFLDIGIACAHIGLAAQAVKLQGEWIIKGLPASTQGWMYVLTWKEKQAGVR
jgi:nitroreductase